MVQMFYIITWIVKEKQVKIEYQKFSTSARSQTRKGIDGLQRLFFLGLPLTFYSICLITIFKYYDSYSVYFLQTLACRIPKN